MIALIGLFSCSDDDETSSTQDLNMQVKGLEDLGADFQYEGWIIVDGAPVSTGTFTVDADRNPSSSIFQVSEENAAEAAKFVVSIEPIPDSYLVQGQ